MSRISVCLMGAAILFAANSGRADDTNPIGISIAADGGSAGSMTGEQPEQLPAADTAGVVPITNWNNLVIDRFTTAQSHSSSSLPTGQNPASSAMAFALNDDTNAASGAQVTAWTGGDTYSVYGTPETNGDQQMMNGLLGSKKTGGTNSPQNASLTIGSIPNYYVTNGYSVYVYFNNNGSGQDGIISLTSGTFTSASYYVATVGPIALNGMGQYVYTDGSASTTAGTYTASNYVDIAVPAGNGSSFQVSLNEPTTGNPGITGLELVPNAPVGVPEPGSLALILFGAVPAAWMIRRRKSA
jgi:hypothetical protein